MRWRTVGYAAHMPRKAPSWPQVRRGTLMRVFGRAAVGSRCGGQGRAGPGVGCGVLDRFAALICPPGYRWVQAGKGSAQAGLATREPARTLGGSKVPVHGRTPPSPWHDNCIPWVYPSPYTTGSGYTGATATTCGGTPGTSIAGGGPQAPTLASTSSPPPLQAWTRCM